MPTIIVYRDEQKAIVKMANYQTDFLRRTLESIRDSAQSGLDMIESNCEPTEAMGFVFGTYSEASALSKKFRELAHAFLTNSEYEIMNSTLPSDLNIEVERR